jgi:hypothetical protein
MPARQVFASTLLTCASFDDWAALSEGAYLLRSNITDWSDDRVQAHILVCFLAFVLWKSLEMWQQRSGLGNSPRTILEENSLASNRTTSYCPP